MGMSQPDSKEWCELLKYLACGVSAFCKLHGFSKSVGSTHELR